MAEVKLTMSSRSDSDPCEENMETASSSSSQKNHHPSFSGTTPLQQLNRSEKQAKPSSSSSSKSPKRKGSKRTKSSVSSSDSRDEAEDEEDSSSLGYSDDSASLSDAYFHPQPGDNLARPYHGRVMNPYQATAPPQSTYGSMPYSTNTNSNHGLSQFWLGGPIQEDSETMYPHLPNTQQSSQSSGEINNDSSTETTSLLPNQSRFHQHNNNNHSNNNNNNSGNTSSGSNEGKPHSSKRDRSSRRSSRSNKQNHHHQQRHHLHRLHMKQRELAAREKAVSLIRGQPQHVTNWQDSCWAVLFVAQLLLVVLCALRFGFGVILFKDHVWGMGSGSWQQDGSDNMVFAGNNSSEYSDNGDDGGGGSRVLMAIRDLLTNTSSLLMNMTSTDATTNSSDATLIPKNASLKDILFAQDDLFLKSDDELEEDAPPSDTTGSFTIDYKNVLAITFFSGFYACILSYISFGFMLILARSLILTMLIFSVLVALAWGVIGLTLDPYGVISVMGFAALISTLGYTMYSWHRIPFAATNLYTALTAMRCTADITILGLLSLVVAFGWCLLWSMAFIGVVNAFNHHDCTQKDACHAHVNRNHIPLYILFVVSFHWTTMVIKNMVRVTVAAAIGTWWYHPSEIGPFCTAAVIRPFLRSMTVSLGSICKGSLVISPAQWALSFGRFCCCCVENESSAADSLNCIGHDGNGNGKPLPFLSFHNSDKDLEDGSGVVADSNKTVDSPADTVGFTRRFHSLIGPCRRWLRCCNRWAFTYIGMYGYSFTEAGDRALQLFETRGWMEVVEDSLIQNVLLMASVVIGGSTGVFAVVVEETDGFDFTSFHQPIITAFVIGSVLGYVLSNILLLGVVGSAVNTVLVGFAAGPFDFDKNHPRLSREMREVWSQQVWEPAPAAVATPIPAPAPETETVAVATGAAASTSTPTSKPGAEAPVGAAIT